MRLAFALLLFAGTAIGQDAAPPVLVLPTEGTLWIAAGATPDIIATCQGTGDAMTDCVLLGGHTLTDLVRVLIAQGRDNQKQSQQQINELRDTCLAQMYRDQEALTEISRLLKPQAEATAKKKKGRAK